MSMVTFPCWLTVTVAIHFGKDYSSSAVGRSNHSDRYFITAPTVTTENVVLKLCQQCLPDGTLRHKFRTAVLTWTLPFSYCQALESN